MIDLLKNIAKESLVSSAESSELTHDPSGTSHKGVYIESSDRCDECDNCVGTSSGCYS